MRYCKLLFWKANDNYGWTPISILFKERSSLPFRFAFCQTSHRSLDFFCTWSLERCLRMWFYELTGVFVGFDVADPIEELKLSLMRLWRYTGNFSGHTNSEREEEDGARGAPPRVWKRKRDLYSEISSAFTRNWWLPMNISWSEGLCSLEFAIPRTLCVHCMPETKSATVLNTKISFSHTYKENVTMINLDYTLHSPWKSAKMSHFLKFPAKNFLTLDDKINTDMNHKSSRQPTTYWLLGPRSTMACCGQNLTLPSHWVYSCNNFYDKRSACVWQYYSDICT